MELPTSSLECREPFLPDPLTRETQFFFLRALGVHTTTTAMKFQTGAALVLQIEKDEEKIEICPTLLRLQGAPFLALVDKGRFRVLMSMTAVQFHNWGHFPGRRVK